MKAKDLYHEAKMTRGKVHAFTCMYTYMAVAGRKRTIVIITFDDLYRVYNSIKIKDTNSHLSTVSVLTFALNFLSIAVKELIKLS